MASKVCRWVGLGMLVAAGLVVPMVAQSAVRVATPEEIREMLRKRIDVEHKSDAIIVAVISKKGREIIAHGKFDSNDPRVPDGKTVFEIGSISKVFTSLLLSEMVLDGEVKLSDLVANFLPATVHVPSRDGKPITLLDLATHYSGLPRLPSNYPARNQVTPDPHYSAPELYDFLSHYTLTRDPGTKYEYSNLGAGLLGYVLTLRAGEDYDSLLRSRITGPLHMVNTAVELTPAMRAQLAPGHNVVMQTTPIVNVDVLEGAGEIRSTLDDMVIFLAANMGLIDTPLRPAMKKMLSIHKPAGPGVEVAMGWHIFTGPNMMVWHSGQTDGYHAFIGFEPRRKLGVVVLSNANSTIDDIATSILDHHISGPTEQPIGPPFVP